MFIIANILFAVAEILDWLFVAYQFILIGYCLISWVNPDPYNPIVRLLRNLTEPVLWRVRKLLPFTYMKGLDFSPILVLIAIAFLRKVIVSTLVGIAVRLGV